MKSEKPKISLFPIFLTVFIDLLGLGIVLPVTPALLLNPAEPILPAETDIHTRTLIYGYLTAIYPIMQFFGAPVLGALSDRHGRKKMLALSLSGTLLGYLLFAYSIITNNIILLFISRALDGFTGGNIAIALSAISDISTEKTRARNFGLIGAAFGLGFILGPYIGGKLADPNIVSWFRSDTPFWFAAILTGLNLILIQFNFKETLLKPKESKVSMSTGLINLGNAIRHPRLSPLFLVVFLITLGFNFFTQFFSVFLISKFKMSVSQVSDIFAYVGLWIVIGQGALQRPLSAKFKPVAILKFSMVVLALVLPLLLVPDESQWLFLVIPFVALSNGLTQPNMTAMVSMEADASEQGQILGINQSIQSIGMAIPPIVAAYINEISINLPIISSASLIFLGWLLLMSRRTKSA
jgi:DHA1 family tetracycline resistance protein-like MFS transporter